MEMASIISLLLFVGLTGCASTQPRPLPNLTPTHTIAEIRLACNWPDAWKGCAKLSKKNVTLEGTLYFPSKNRYQPKLFPTGIKIPAHDNDELWGAAEFPDPIDMKATTLSRRQKQMIRKYHLKPVMVKAVAHTGCVSATFWLFEQSTEDETFFIGGYCHTQSSVYLTDFKITEIKQ